MATLRTFEPKGRAGTCTGCHFLSSTNSVVPGVESLGPHLAGHPMGSLQTSGQLSSLISILPWNGLAFEVQCVTMTIVIRQRMTQSNCRFWQRPAEQTCNSKASYSFCENKLHHCLPRSLPTRLKSVFFWEWACKNSA